MCGRRGRHEGGETAGGPRNKKKIVFIGATDLTWNDTKPRWSWRDGAGSWGLTNLYQGAPSAGEPTKECPSCRVFSAQHLASAPMTPILLLIYITKQLWYGGVGVGPLCVQQRGCADKHTNITLSFCEQEQLNPNAHTLAASPQPPFAAGKPDSRRAALQSECGQSVSPCFLISLPRHRPWKYTTEQRMDSFVQQRAQANRSRVLNKDEGGEVLLHGRQRCIWQTPETRPKAWLLYSFINNIADILTH